MNKLILIGRMTADPDTRTTTNGKTVCNFSIAVDRKFKSQGGETVTDFFNIKAWGALGEVCSKYLSKGKKVFVSGELQARSYETKSGTTGHSLDVMAAEVEFLSPKQETPHELDLSGFTDIPDEELPF